MAAINSVLADASFLHALIDRRDRHHGWAKQAAAQFPPPWRTCEAVLTECFFILGAPGGPALSVLLRNGAVSLSFEFGSQQDSVLALMEKYANVPMSFADACLVRMSEILAEPIVLTTDADFRIYRRHSRQAVPCVLPD